MVLHHGNAVHALELLRPATAYDTAFLIVRYVRASAYLQSRKAQEAVQEFQRVRDLHALRPENPFISLAFVGEGRAYQMMGDTTKAHGLSGFLRPLERHRR